MNVLVSCQRGDRVRRNSGRVRVLRFLDENFDFRVENTLRRTEAGQRRHRINNSSPERNSRELIFVFYFSGNHSKRECKCRTFSPFVTSSTEFFVRNRISSPAACRNTRKISERSSWKKTKKKIPFLSVRRGGGEGRKILNRRRVCGIRGQFDVLNILEWSYSIDSTMMFARVFFFFFTSVFKYFYRME